MTKPLALLTLFASFGAAPAAYAAETPPQKEDLMRKANPGFTEDIHNIYVTTGGEREIPKRYEEWTAPPISVVERCEPCLRFHLRHARSAGASATEMVEALRIGLPIGGSITLPTVRTGYEEIAAPGS